MTPVSPGRAGRVTQLSVSGVTLRAGDGVRLHAVLLPHPTADLAVVVGHGLTNHVARPAVRRVCARLARLATVLAVDFRGHGRSGGESSVGEHEVLDLVAAVERARSMGYRRVATLGFSLGAAVALRHAARCAPADDAPAPDAVVAVSTPARWWVRETPAMRRVHWLLEQPHGRLAARALGVRLGPVWGEPPESPLEAVHRIGAPLLLVHGTRDHYFPPEQAVALHRATRGHGELWLVDGLRHAESAMTPDLVDRVAGWLADNAGMSAARPGDRHEHTVEDELVA